MKELKDHIRHTLNKFPEVTWDRWAGDGVEHACVYGWVPNHEPGRHDYVLIFLDASGPWMISTSSAKYSREFSERIGLGNNHSDCKRVEVWFPGVKCTRLDHSQTAHPFVSREEHEAVVKELNDRLIERNQGIVEQMQRVEETWRAQIRVLEDQRRNRESLFAAVRAQVRAGHVPYCECRVCSLGRAALEAYDAVDAVSAATPGEDQGGQECPRPIEIVSSALGKAKFHPDRQSQTADGSVLLEFLGSRPGCVEVYPNGDIVVFVVNGEIDHIYELSLSETQRMISLLSKVTSRVVTAANDAVSADTHGDEGKRTP